MKALRRFWAERTERERRILLAGGALLMVLMGWQFLVEPALAGRAYWRERLPALRAERAQMQNLVRQVSAAPPPARAASPLDRQTLERSLTDAGLKPQNLNVGEVLVRANFSDVSFAALADWLQQSQRQAQLAVTEASVSAHERIDRVDAALSLRRLQ